MLYSWATLRLELAWPLGSTWNAIKRVVNVFRRVFFVFFNGIIAEKCTKISSDVASVLHKLYRGVDSACGSRFAFVSHLSLLL